MRKANVWHLAFTNTKMNSAVIILDSYNTYSYSSVTVERIRQLQEQRKQLLREMCDGDEGVFPEGRQSLEDLSDNELKHLIVDDNHGIIYCYIPKVILT